MQPFPTSGLLARNLDRGKPQIVKQTDRAKGEVVYSYVVSTVRLGQSGEYRQRGSAPNFQGDRLTLCTCKHQMRARLDLEDWPGKWVAGLSSRSYDGNHWLIYLARIERSYESHCELWFDLPANIQQAKSARRSKVGDLYEPLRPLIDGRQFDPAYYREPLVGHVHHRGSADHKWKDDIDYRRKNLKRPSTRIAPLLVGDRALTFLWRQPALCLTENHIRDYEKWPTLNEFLKRIRSDVAFSCGSASTRVAAECKARC